LKTNLYLFLLILIIIMVSVSYNPTLINEGFAYADSNLIDEITKEEIIAEKIVYDGLTREKLIERINKSLNSTISNKGELIVDTSLEMGVDPYLATAIILHETGCKWECSTLVKSCNNVAGQKAKPSCNGGSYKKYDTLDDGIRGAIYNISVNYVQMGLLTAEEMNSKYAEDPKWAVKVNKYISDIRSK